MKEKLIKTTREQQQRYSVNCALAMLSVNGAEFEPKFDNLSLLITLVGRGVIKEHYKDRFDEIVEKIDNLRKYTAEIVSYLSGLRKKTIDREDVTSPRFLRYQETLSNALDYLFFLDEITLFLVNKTDLRKITITSSHLSYATQKLFDTMPIDYIGEEKETEEPEEKDEDEEDEDEDR